MRSNIQAFLFIVLFALIPSAQAQHSKAVKLYERGQAALSKGNGDEAVRLLKQAVDADSTLIEAHLMLAEWMLDAGNKDEALHHYLCVTRQNATFHTPAWLELANLQLANDEYDNAINSYNRFLELDKRSPKRHPEAEKGIATARFRQQAIANPVAFNPVNLGDAINSPDDEYLPALTVDGETMVFTRRFPRRSTTTANTRDEEDIYTSTIKQSDNQALKQWQKASPLPSPLNSTDNEGAECISQDGRIMFFTACGRQDGGGRCDLYMCIRRGDKWGKPRNIGMPVNSGAWEGQPSFSIDGKTLYFVSNRKGGYGGMDIWKSTFEDGRWTEPVNLGPEINTPGNEMSPFIHYDDQTLYFASDGHIGMGGLDIFVSRKSKASADATPDFGWSTPVNLGYPINTAADESSLIVDATATRAYFSSDREGGFGKLDIYSFELPAPLRPIPTICYKGKVFDKETGATVAADIRIVDLSKVSDIVANTSSDASSGLYAISLPTGRSYAFHVTAKGYLFHSLNVDKTIEQLNIVGRTDGTAQTIDIPLEPIKAGSHIALRNIFFETGKAELLPQSQYELGRLVELLQNNPTLSVEIGGHTDNVGSDDANQKLSEARAKAVYDHLTGNGITASRLSFRGYGESRPVATNDTPESRAENRRVEMTVK